MANVATTIQRLSVEFNLDSTDVYVYLHSTEPDNPFWGDGCRHKSFGPTKSLEAILPEIANYLHWDIVCPLCHGPKTPEPGAKFCGHVCHVDQGKNLLGIFDEDVVSPV
jgi:hypothetical protein